jgi:CYTH domain-containing protein
MKSLEIERKFLIENATFHQALESITRVVQNPKDMMRLYEYRHVSYFDLYWDAPHSSFLRLRVKSDGCELTTKKSVEGSEHRQEINHEMSTKNGQELGEVLETALGEPSSIMYNTAYWLFGNADQDVELSLIEVVGANNKPSLYIEVESTDELSLARFCSFITDGLSDHDGIDCVTVTNSFYSIFVKDEPILTRRNS